MFHDMAMLRQESIRVELGIQRYLGSDMNGLKYDDLTKLEEELEFSLAKVRNRQVNIKLITLLIHLFLIIHPL